MKKNPLNKGVVSKNFAGIGTVTRAMVRARAEELALIDGRTAHEISTDDWEQAKRELTGGGDPDLDQQGLAYEPGFPGRQVPESPPEDEDAEGQGETAQLIQEGVAEAEHDQMLQAAKKALHEDQ